MAAEENGLGLGKWAALGNAGAMIILGLSFLMLIYYFLRQSAEERLLFRQALEGQRIAQEKTGEELRRLHDDVHWLADEWRRATDRLGVKTKPRPTEPKPIEPDKDKLKKDGTD